MRRAALALGLLAGAACTEDPVYQTGLVDRPSGLAYVEWANDPAEPLSARGDVFVADPEAGGVSVIQLGKTTSSVNGALVVDDRYIYARAPNLFFPLVLPAPSYPSRVATASLAGSRLYVLSPVDARLHVYAIGPGTYGASSSVDDPYARLGSIDLGSAAPDGAVSRGVVVDVAVLHDGGGAEPDVLVLALDDLSQGGLLFTLKVGPKDGALAAEWTSSASIGPGPRRLAVRRAAPAGVLVSSAGSSTVSLVSLLDGRLADKTVIDVGGPTSAVVDAGDSGAVALRLDRPAAVVLDVVDGRLEPSARELLTPYASASSGGGELSLRAMPVAGAAGAIPRFPTTAQAITGRDLFTEADRGPDGLATAVYLAYSDGGGAFLVGKPLRWPTQSILPLSVSYGAARGLELTSCPSLAPVACEALNVSAESDIAGFACAGAQVAQGLERVRATYLGAFASVATTTLAASSTIAPVLATLDAGTALDAARAGDRVFVAGALARVCTSTLALAGEGTLRARDGDGRWSVELDPGPLADTLAACDAPARVRAEVYAAEPEVVVDTGPGTPVLERLRTTTTASAGFRIARSSGALVAELRVPETATCAAALTSAVGCADDADCPGAACARSELDVCGGRCAPRCASTDLGCWRSRPERRCPTVELAVARSAADGAELPFGFAADAAATLPDDVVFSSVRGAWIVSFPGARMVGSVGLDVLGILSTSALK